MKKPYSYLLLLFLFFAVGQMNSQTFDKKLDDLFQNEFATGDPGVIVLIAKDGKAIYRKAFGSADLELDVPLKPENVMELGSLTKQFTAGAILILMEEGKLSLQDPLSKYIPEYPNGENITVHHLLNHTSGIKDYITIPGLNPSDEMSPSEIVAFLRDAPVDFAPGEKWKYSNSGYILLGYIIEKASKMTYQDYIQIKIFKPLEMNNSRYGSKKDLIPNRASGYRPNSAGPGFINAPALNMTIPYASGALMSTVEDMLLWNQAWRHDTLISEKSKQLAFTPAILNNGTPFYYGYGWHIRRLYGSPSFEHAGRIFGFATYTIYIPEENIYTIVLSNNESKNLENIALQATATVLGKPLNTSTTNVSLSEKSLKKWTGAYAFEDGAIRYVTYKDGSLYSRREDGEPIQLHAISENEFQFDNSFVTSIFGKEKGKKVFKISGRTEINKGQETKTPPEK